MSELKCNIMILSDTLKKNNILVNAGSKEPAELFDKLLNLAVKNGEIQPDDLVAVKSALIAREKSMTTGIGKGLAIPHCTSPKVNNSIVMLATINEGLNFAAVDDKPVYIAVLLVFPKSRKSPHVKELAEIAKVLGNNELMKKLLSLKTPNEILKAVKKYETGE